MIVKELFAKLGLEIDELAFEKGEQAIHGLHHGLMRFVEATSAGLAVISAAIVKETAEAGDAALKLAQKTGLPLDTLQQFAYAANLADVSTETLAHGLQHLAKTGVKDVRAEMFRLATQFQKMPDDGRKVQLAMQKFGRAGAELIPLLNGGREELEKLMGEAEELGLVFSKEDAEASQEFNDSLRRLMAGLKGAAFQIGKALLPYAQALVTALQGYVKSFAAFMDRLKKDAKLRQDLLGWLRVLGLLLGAAGLTRGVMGLVGTFKLLSVEAIAAAIKAALAWGAAALPFVLIGAVVAGLILVLEDLYGFFTGKDSVIGEFVDAVKKYFGVDLKNTFLTFKDDTLATFEVFRQLAEPFVWAFDKIKEGIKALGDAIRNSPLAQLGLAVAVHSALPDVVQAAAPGASVEFAAAAANLFAGGARSPGDAAFVGPPRPGSVSVQAPVNVTIQTQPGMNPQDVAGATVAAMDDWWHGKVRAAIAGVD